MLYKEEFILVSEKAVDIETLSRHPQFNSFFTHLLLLNNNFSSILSIEFNIIRIPSKNVPSLAFTAVHPPFSSPRPSTNLTRSSQLNTQPHLPPRAPTALTLDNLRQLQDAPSNLHSYLSKDQNFERVPLALPTQRSCGEERIGEFEERWGTASAGAMG